MAESSPPKWLLSLKTALGEGALTPIAFRADEAISEPFHVSVEGVSRQRLVDPDQMLFKPATVTVRPNVGEPRLFNGMVQSVTASGTPDRGWWHYTISIVPKLWFMGQTADCRVFQQVPVTDILTTLCGEAGQTLSLKASPGTVFDYVTQYNETDLQFAARLMEQAGFFYFFQHSDGDHVLVVADQNSAFPSSPSPTLTVIHEGGSTDTLTAWQQTRHTAWGRARLIDYDPANPKTMPDGNTSTVLKASGASGRDVTVWPALSLSGSVVTARTKIMIEAAEAEASLIDTSGRTHTLSAGSRFKIYRDPFSQAMGVEHVVRRVLHTGDDESYLGGTEAATYSNELSVFPSTVPWRQPMVTPRPVMAGVHGAIVLGNTGEEIHADSLGRIKVRMFWDHRSETVATQATWVRVIQPWAGDSWGWQHLPRVGTEVAVSFMDGDPDRPVVVGGLYNGTMAPVFPVPGQENKSGWRTRSTKSGGTSDFSEFSVDDTKGAELMFVHAQKDMTREVENDDKLTVTHDQTIEIDNTQTVTVKAGRTTTINRGGDALTVQAGDLTIKVSTGQVSVEAMVAIELKVGGSTVKIDPSGISVDGPMIKLNGQAMVQVKAPMTQVNGDGMLVMKGGVVLVN